MVPIVSSMSATKVKVEWVAPNSGSLNITRYLIEVLSGDTVNYYQTSSCNGQDTLVIANVFCQIPMSELTSYPFNIPQGRLI